MTPDPGFQIWKRDLRRLEWTGKKILKMCVAAHLTLSHGAEYNQGCKSPDKDLRNRFIAECEMIHAQHESEIWRWL